MRNKRNNSWQFTKLQMATLRFSDVCGFECQVERKGERFHASNWAVYSQRANMDLIDDVKTALMLLEHSIWRPVQVKTCSGGTLRSVGFSAQETAWYRIHCDLTHFLLVCSSYFVLRTAVSRQLTACTTLIYYFDTYDTRFHSLAFPPLLLGDCHQALWVGMRSNIQKDGDEDCKNA